MALQAAIASAQKRAASGASTKNTVTGQVTPQLGATNEQLIAQNKTGVPAANQANILGKPAPVAPVVSTVTQQTYTPTPIQSQPVNTPQPSQQTPAAPVTSYEDMAKGQIQKEYDDISKTGADLGISTYTSIDQQFQDTIRRQREQKAAQEKQLALQKSGAIQDAEENKNAISSAAEVQKSQLSDNQEGFSSGSNRAASSQFTAAVNQKLARIEQEKSSAMASVDAAQKALNNAELAGNTELASKYRASLEGAKQQVQALEDAHIQAQINANQNALATVNQLSSSGVLAGADLPTLQKYASQYGVPVEQLQAAAKISVAKNASEARQQQFENQGKAIATFKDMVSAGTPISLSLAKQYSAQTGLPLDALLSFNESAAAVMADKTLSNEQKQQLIEEKGYELDQKSRGIFTQAQQNYDYLARMYNEGASQEAISAFKSAAGIKDFDDPMYVADLKLKNAQAAIEEKKLRGEPVTVDDQIKLLEAQQEYGDLGGYNDVGGGISGEMVISNNPPQAGCKVSTENGQFKVTVPPNTQFQCGAYVNRVWGDKIFASAGTQKMAQIDKYGFKVKGANPAELAVKVKPGMAFVMPIANNSYDHVGLVEKVLPDGIITNEANANGKATTKSVGPGANNITSRFLSWNQLYGFMAPPNSKSVGGTPNVSNSTTKLNLAALQTLTTKELEDGFKNGTYDFNQLTPKAFERVKSVLGDDKIKAIQNGGSGAENDPKKIASNIMQGNIGLDLDSIKQDLRPAVAEELGKMKQSALQSGDTLGYLKASAGGKQLDSTAVQNLGKAQNVLSQLPGLEETINSIDTGPINNIFSANNPYDKKVALLKAQLQAIVPNLARGVYGEVGVLTDNDIKNYIATLPNNASTEDQKKALMDFTKKTIANSIENNLKNYAMAGYNVSGYTPILESLGGGSQKKSTKLFDAATNFIKNNFNSQGAEENQWNHIDTTTSNDVLNQFS